MNDEIPEHSGAIVHVIEDDDSTREATARFLRAAGHVVRTYASAVEFLEASPSNGPGCLVLDLRMPGPSGFDLQQALMDTSDPLPIIFLSGLGEVPDSVRAMKDGAVDFLTKSADGGALLDAVSRALALDADNRLKRARQRDVRSRYERLSPREREVFTHLIGGQLNKQVGFELGISEHTVKIHRGRVLDKMEANSIADLVRLATELGIDPVRRAR